MSSANKKWNAMRILREENESDLIEVTVKRNVKAEEEEEERRECNTRGQSVSHLFNSTSMLLRPFPNSFTEKVAKRVNTRMAGIISPPNA